MTHSSGMNGEERLSIREFLSWLADGFERGRFDRRPRMGRSLILLIASLIMMAAIYLTLVSTTASRGRRLEELNAELRRLQRENENLAVEISEVSSVTRLMERARELGFVPAEELYPLPIPDDGEP